MRIAANRTITFYGGKVYNEDNWPEDSAYVLKVTHGTSPKAAILFIDGEGSGLLAASIIHSWSPNCKMEQFIYNGVIMVAIISLRVIEPQEFLSVSYNDSHFEHIPMCCCGAKNCRDRAKYLAAIKAGKLYNPLVMFSS